MKDLLNLFNQQRQVLDFDAIRIGPPVKTYWLTLPEGLRIGDARDEQHVFPFDRGKVRMFDPAEIQFLIGKQLQFFPPALHFLLIRRMRTFRYDHDPRGLHP